MKVGTCFIDLWVSGGRRQEAGGWTGTLTIHIIKSYIKLVLGVRMNDIN